MTCDKSAINLAARQSRSLFLWLSDVSVASANSMFVSIRVIAISRRRAEVFSSGKSMPFATNGGMATNYIEGDERTFSCILLPNPQPSGSFCSPRRFFAVSVTVFVDSPVIAAPPHLLSV